MMPLHFRCCNICQALGCMLYTWVENTDTDGLNDASVATSVWELIWQVQQIKSFTRVVANCKILCGFGCLKECVSCYFKHSTVNYMSMYEYMSPLAQWWSNLFWNIFWWLFFNHGCTIPGWLKSRLSPCGCHTPFMTLSKNRRPT